jgi:hypothetical protein
MSEHDSISLPKTMIILYVHDQAVSKTFYRNVLNHEPSLDVPGMTEFELTKDVLLGLMPNDGIAQLLGTKVPHPDSGTGIPRCEIYIPVSNPDECYYNLIQLGGTGISGGTHRNWGHYVAYGADPDGHVIAFAKQNL